MTANETRKPTVSRKSIGWQALFVVALLLIICFLWLRDRPERLANVPNRKLTVSGENLYMFAATNSTDSSAPTIQAQSIYSGGMREIRTDDARYQFYNFNAPDAFSIVAGKLYYALEPRSRPETSYGAVMDNTNPVRFLGTFLLSPKRVPGSSTAGQKRLSFPIPPLSPKEARFRQISLREGTSRDVVTLRGESFCLVGSHVFWIQPLAEERDEIIQGRNAWFEISAHSDLMLTSLTDGTTRCIRHGIPRETALTAGSAGVSWKEPMPMPSLPMQFYARVLDGSVHSMGIVADKYQNVPRYVEFENRLYWMTPFNPRFLNSHMLVMSANLDGSDTREVCTQINKRVISTVMLAVAQGRLYACITATPLDTEDRFKPTTFLCRLHPDRSDPIEILHKLPRTVSHSVFADNYQFEGHYLYFVWHDQKRSLWATMTNDEVGGEYVDTLYRLPLDK